MNNKPIGATQEQLDENELEWVIGRKFNVGLRKPEPQWILVAKQELEWEKQQTKLLQEIANLKRDCIHLAKCIDPFDTNDYTYNILRKYIPELPEKHPMDK